MDPKLTEKEVKELFIAIVSNLPEESTLKKITNCPSFTVSLSKFEKEQRKSAIALLPENANMPTLGFKTKKEILEKVKTNTTAETLDLEDLDPALDEEGVKQLFIDIVSQLPEGSNLKKITNCPPFTVSIKEIDKKNQYSAIVLFPKDQHVKMNCDQAMYYDCSGTCSMDYANGLNNKSITFSHLILRNPTNEFLEIMKNATVQRLTFMSEYKIANGEQALEAIKSMNPDEISLELEMPQEGQSFINWNQLNSTHDVSFEITTKKIEENKAHWENKEEVSDTLTDWQQTENLLESLKKSFVRGELNVVCLCNFRNFSQDNLKEIVWHGTLKKKQETL
ncbi:MAG: hypothetical protein JSR80_08465 [Verrucomicrobia bacterium]|nr:hypothetical protein [Verrucomicrobiota bacterium]